MLRVVDEPPLQEVTQSYHSESQKAGQRCAHRWRKRERTDAPQSLFGRFGERPGRAVAGADVFSATAARISAWSAFSSISSSSWKSMARLVLPWRLELKRPDGSGSEA